MMTGLVFVVTTLVKIPLPAGGYIHLGDAVIYIFATILPLPFAIFGASVGASLADFASGFIPYMLPTAIIKALYIPFFRLKNKNKYYKFIIAPAFAGLVCILGYFIFEWLFYGNWVNALWNSLFNLVQCLCSALVFYIVSSNLKIKTE